MDYNNSNRTYIRARIVQSSSKIQKLNFGSKKSTAPIPVKSDAAYFTDSEYTTEIKSCVKTIKQIDCKTLLHNSQSIQSLSHVTSLNVIKNKCIANDIVYTTIDSSRTKKSMFNFKRKFTNLAKFSSSFQDLNAKISKCKSLNSIFTRHYNEFKTDINHATCSSNDRTIPPKQQQKQQQQQQQAQKSSSKNLLLLFNDNYATINNNSSKNINRIHSSNNKNNNQSNIVLDINKTTSSNISSNNNKAKLEIFKTSTIHVYEDINNAKMFNSTNQLNLNNCNNNVQSKKIPQSYSLFNQAEFKLPTQLSTSSVNRQKSSSPPSSTSQTASSIPTSASSLSCNNYQHESSPVSSSHAVPTIHNQLPVNNKIQLLKLRFNLLSQTNSLGSNINNETSVANTTSNNTLNTKPPSSGNITTNSNSVESFTNISNSSVKNSKIPTKTLPNHVNQYMCQRPHSQETIIEECKQSLDELIKASKWSMRSNLSNVKSHDNLNSSIDSSMSFNNNSANTTNIATCESSSDDYQTKTANLLIQLNDTSSSLSGIPNSYKSSLQLKLKSSENMITPVNDNCVSNKLNKTTTTTTIKYNNHNNINSIVNTSGCNIYASTPLISSSSSPAPITNCILSSSKQSIPLITNYKPINTPSSVNNSSTSNIISNGGIIPSASLNDTNNNNNNKSTTNLNDAYNKIYNNKNTIKEANELIEEHHHYHQQQQNISAKDNQNKLILDLSQLEKTNQISENKYNSQQQLVSNDEFTNETLLNNNKGSNFNHKFDNNRRSETLTDSTVSLARQLSDNADQTQLITSLPPPGRSNSIIQQQQQQSASRPLSCVNNSESMSSFKSLISAKSTSSGLATMHNADKFNVLPSTPPIPPTSIGSRKSTPEPGNSNSKKKDIKEKRKRNNSWIANSFRKAFGKEKKKSIENDEDSGNNSNGSSNNNNNKKSNVKASSRRSCASDDENQLHHSKSSSSKRDSDSDFDDNYHKINKNKSGNKLSKRSYRSESELLDENLSRKNNNVHEGSIVTSIAVNGSTNGNHTIARKTFNPSGISGTSLHNYKSCSSILTSSNSNEDSSSTKSQKCTCKKLSIHDDLVSDLKIKLTNTENKLTDIRLEALSSVHHVDQLKECLDKLKCEMISLRSENKVLKNYIKDVKSQEFSLLTSKRDSFNDSFITETEQEEQISNKKFDTFLKSISSVNNNVMNYCYSYNFLLDDENEALLRKAYVTIKCLYHENSQTEFKHNKNSSECNLFECKHEICIINIDSKLKWKLMDGIITYVFKRYLKLIDPMDKLGINKNSIEKYNIGEITRYLNDTKLPSLLPFGYLVGDNCTIEIVLKDNNKQLDQLAYDTLIPKYLLDDYVNLIIKNKYLAIKSSIKFGKTYLMRKIAQFMSKHLNNHVEIIYYDLDDLSALTAVHNNENTNLTTSNNKTSNYYNDEQNIKNLLLTNLYNKIINLNNSSNSNSRNNNNQTVIILIDNFHDIFVNNNKSKNSFDIIQSIIKLQSILNFYFIVTIRSDYEQNSFSIPLEFDKHFKRINLNLNEEPLTNFLHRYLHKNLIKHQVLQYKSKDFNILMEKIIDWLLNVFKFMNEYIQKHGFFEYLLSPFIFVDMPVDVEKSELWFLQLWNYTLIPYLNDLLKDKLTSKIEEIEEPLDLILDKYPWPIHSNANSIKTRLSRLKSNRNSICETSQLNLDFNGNSNKNDHRLISMLLRLQQTTGINNTKHNKEDHSSGFYESSASSSPKSSNSPVPTLATGVFSVNLKQIIESSL